VSQVGKSGVSDPIAPVEVDVGERGWRAYESRVGDVAAPDVQVSEERGGGVEEESESGVGVAGVRKSQRPEGAPRSAVEDLRVRPAQTPEPGEQTRPPVWRPGASDKKAKGAAGQLGSPVFARQASDGQVFLEKGGDELENFAGKARPVG